MFFFLLSAFFPSVFVVMGAARRAGQLVYSLHSRIIKKKSVNMAPVVLVRPDLDFGVGVG